MINKSTSINSTLSSKFNLRLGWGTGSSFGNILDEHKAHTVISLLLDNGINVFDTGSSYANGKSERMLGNCLQSIGVDRHSLILSTKIGSYTNNLFGLSITHKNYGRDTTQYIIEKSLLNLRTDYIDIIFFHSLPTCLSPPEETLDLLLSLKDSGVIKAIGVSAHSLKELIDFQ